jgi:hypothetical protein
MREKNVDSDRRLPINERQRLRSMSEHTVTLDRAPGVSEDEVKARLGRVYRLLIEIARRGETADGVEVASPKPSAVGDQHVWGDG